MDKAQIIVFSNPLIELKCPLDSVCYGYCPIDLERSVNEKFILTTQTQGMIINRFSLIPSLIKCLVVSGTVISTLWKPCNLV